MCYFTVVSGAKACKLRPIFELSSWVDWGRRCRLGEYRIPNEFKRGGRWAGTQKNMASVE